jgi:hypothetical protein
VFFADTFAIGIAMTLAACAAGIPQAELDRCSLGAAYDNDAFTMRQGAACRAVAQRLAASEDTVSALGYARKACQLQDGRGCEEYLALVRGQPALARDELQDARVAGEKACAGIVVAADGVDVRARICAQTAELYLDLEPKSRSDAGRLYARACKLGDGDSCLRARALGVDVEVPQPAPVAAPRAAASAPVVTVSSPPPAQACHSMRACVGLDVKQHNATEVIGTLTSRCDRPVLCSFCPVRGADVDKAACRTTTLAPNEAKAGRDAGLWYDGYSGIAYDCTDANDDRMCLP